MSTVSTARATVTATLLALMVNADGERFVDEGADFRNYTYAKYGRVVLAQPGGYAWQVFDAQVIQLLRDEYKMRGATKVRADSLEELVSKMQDVNPAGFMKTIADYNAAVKRDVKFDPNIKDGKATVGLTLNKSNWANTMAKPPFEAYSVGCGITFTFGGLKIDTKAMCWTSTTIRSRGFMRRASWSADCGISTIREARD